MNKWILAAALLVCALGWARADDAPPGSDADEGVRFRSAASEGLSQAVNGLTNARTELAAVHFLSDVALYEESLKFEMVLLERFGSLKAIERTMEQGDDGASADAVARLTKCMSGRKRLHRRAGWVRQQRMEMYLVAIAETPAAADYFLARVRGFDEALRIFRLKYDDAGQARPK